MLAEAVREIQIAEIAWRRARARHARFAHPIRQIDSLIAQLEELHLAGLHRVPAAWAPQLQALLASVPVDCRRPFPLRTTISRLMNVLYEMQDCLLDRRDARRQAYREQDTEIERIGA